LLTIPMKFCNFLIMLQSSNIGFVPMKPFGWSIHQPLSLVITATVCVWNSSCISWERDCFAVVAVSKFGFGMFLEV
jgi:hypothetical protein